ncbi:MAG: 16S rRNA (guanine(527)-N(7))-methyltransferase RsmG [Pirellulaceae bacterium]
MAQDDSAEPAPEAVSAASTGDNPANSESLSGTLGEAIERLNSEFAMELDIPAEAVEKLSEYCRLLWDWNTKVNLTRHTTWDLFARRDLLDSYRLAKQLAPEEDVLDVGTGGGVPGILLAILRPDLNVMLCDSVEKKARIVKSIVEGLELPIAVHATRAQLVVQDLRFHSLVTRAVGSLAKLLTWLKDDWVSFDRLLAIKGPRWVEERGQARHLGLLANLELRVADSYPMPGTESESIILEAKHRR